MGLSFEIFLSTHTTDDGTIHLPFLSVSLSSTSIMVLLPIVGFIISWRSKR